VLGQKENKAVLADFSSEFDFAGW